MWAFFDPGALGAWWQTARSVTTPRILGPYAVEWAPTDFKDEMLGRLGGTFHGTVMDYKAARERCDSLAGTAKNYCINQAKTAHGM